MIRVLDGKIKNFDRVLDKLLSKRKNKIQLKSTSIIKIIKDVKINGDKAILRYEKKFNKNNIIIPNPKKITKSIKSLGLKVEMQAMLRLRSTMSFRCYSNETNSRMKR